MPKAEFITMMSSPTQLGNPLIATQHLIGGSKWRKLKADGDVSEEEIVGWHQLRAAHQLYARTEEVEIHGNCEVNGNGELYGEGGEAFGKTHGQGKRGKEVLANGHGHAVIEMRYKKDEEGIWKLAGLKPEVRFDEGDIGRVFGRVK